MIKILANAMVTVMKTVAIVKYDKLNKETGALKMDEVVEKTSIK